METNVLSGRLAIFRINYKSDFILTLESDAGWMTPFCIKFWTGAPSQAFFAQWDGETYTHCAPVAGEPTKLLVQFDDHHLPIGELKYQVAYHFTVDDFPNDTEDEVINQAAVIIDNNGRDEKVLLDFNGETAPDIAFSLPAYANEAQRIANEQQRIANETQRIANEETRIQHEESRIAAEQTRQQNEQQRINQEQARVNEYASLKADAVAATGAANDAAALANAKSQLAADKAALAQAAANLANAKAQLAADKAALAASAAQLANDKAALAQQKADYAQTQGNYAKAQGDYAKEQGDTALADHRRAEVDHGIAVDDHTQAGNDHTRAESDHGIAVDDHTQAGNDHTRAESDHGIAADDHTQAGNDHQTAAADHQTAGADHTQAGNDHTRAESDHSRAESDHAAVEVYVDSLGAYDISAANAVGGVLATYADLTAALGNNGANIPELIRKGGMSVKFVLSSDNKYVGYFLTKDEWSTSVNDWERNVLEDEISGIIIYNKNKTIESGSYRIVSNDFPELENEEFGSLLINGLAEGQVALANSNWVAQTIIPFADGATSYFIIPENCPNIIIGTKNDAVVSEDTQFHITIVKGGVFTETKMNASNIKEVSKILNDSIKNNSLINVSSEFPTGGTNGTNIFTPSNARAIIPINRRKLGTMLIYLTESGIRIERFDYSEYSNDQWLYGIWTVLSAFPIFNIGLMTGNILFSKRVDAFNYIPDIYKKTGLIISYNLNGRTVIEQFIGTTWTSVNSSWMRMSDITDIANLNYYDESIQENLFYAYLQPKYFEIGSIYNGNEINNSKHCRSVYFSCKQGDSIVCKNRNFEFVLFAYDENKTYLTSSAWNDYKCDISTNGYFRLVLRNTTNTDFDLDDILLKDIILVHQIDNNYQYESLRLHTRQRVLWSQKGDFVMGYLSNGVITTHNSRMSTLRYYPVKKGDKVFVNNNLYSFYVTEYNVGKQFISASPYYSREYISPGLHPFGWYIVKNDGFVRLTFSLIEGNWDSTIVDTADRFFGIVPQEISFEERMAWDEINHSKIIIEKKPLFAPTQETIYQDGTFINGNLWLFPENDGTINIINPETGVVISTKTHTLGHCSSVDYNKNNDCLICKQEGSEHATTQKLQIYKNPSSVVALSPNDANCTLVNLFNDDFHFNDEGTGSVMWGEANDIVYFCNGREDSETGNPNQWSNKHYIYKLRLGMGNNDLSSQLDGMGVFVSGKANDEYNGTCCIINTYVGYVMEGCDTHIGSNSSSYFQGAEYDGYIYVGFGVSGHNFLKIELDDDYGTFKVVENYMHKFFDASHNEIFYEPELVALNNGRIYCGSRKYGEGSVLLSFSL